MVDLTTHARNVLALEVSKGNYAIATRDAATAVGRHARRLGMSKQEVQKWLQKEYGATFVRGTNLIPPYSLKEVWKFIEKAMTPSRFGTVDGQDQLESYLDAAVLRLKELAPAFRLLRMRYGPRLDHEAHQLLVDGKPAIVFGPKFLDYPEPQQDWILAHEIGHWIADEVGLPVLIQEAEELGIDPWDSAELPWDRAYTNMHEAFAESFVVAVLGDDPRWPEWQQLALSLAEQVL